MSITTATKNAQPSALDLKQGVAYATAATADASEKAIKATKDFAAFNQASLAAFTQAGQILTAGTQDLFRQRLVAEQEQRQEEEEEEEMKETRETASSLCMKIADDRTPNR